MIVPPEIIIDPSLPFPIFPTLVWILRGLSFAIPVE